MNLEDHLGDIVRKARGAAGVSAAAAARAAGLSVGELDILEASGQCATTPDLRALAELLGLNPSKFAGIAGGWLPRKHPLDRWRELRQICTIQDGNAVNCFLAWDPESREAALFDTGWEASPAIRFIEENRLVLKRLFVTHSHQDHVAGLRKLRERFAGLSVHTGTTLRGSEGPERPAGTVGVGRLVVQVRSTPGHAEEGVVYLVENWPDQAPSVLFAGDTIFAGSMARGFISAALLKRSVREQVLSLPPNTLICPGHGPVTTVQEELEHNPFF
jgi:hydroxyacylglutathione hydrolase